jgi:hypothetical protein
MCAGKKKRNRDKKKNIFHCLIDWSPLVTILMPLANDV